MPALIPIYVLFPGEIFEFMKEVGRVNERPKFISIGENISNTEFGYKNLIVMDLNRCQSAWSTLFHVRRMFIDAKRVNFYT